MAYIIKSANSPARLYLARKFTSTSSPMEMKCDSISQREAVKTKDWPVRLELFTELFELLWELSEL